MNIMTEEVRMAQHKYETPMEGRISKLEETLHNFIKESRLRQKDSENMVWGIKKTCEQTFKTQASSIKEIEIHLGRIAKIIQDRETGSLPSSTETNPRGLANAITTRSGLNYKPPKNPLKNITTSQEELTTKTTISNGKVGINKALADHGARISLMPYFMYARLDLGELKLACMCIKLANKSTLYPRGIAENVIVKMDKFIFPMDFEVLDMKEVHKILINLVRPFLATTHAMIDVFNKKISFEVGNETITFDIEKSMKFSTPEDDECLFVDLIDNVVLDLEEEEDDSEDLDKSGLPSYPDNWETLRLTLFFTNSFEAENQPPKLKELPSHLEYAFLNNNQEFLVIISSLLNTQEKESLLKVLTQHKAALAWKVADIKGISPSFCTYKILMEDNFKPVVQPQRRLNPKVQDVVKAEIVKLLDSGLIYAISDSPWVSPIHVVPKKEGVTVITNENNKLVPTRTVTGWRVCIDYRKLNDATRKDHFPLPFIDQMLERLSGNEYYCFLDGFSGYFQIPLAPEYQEKTTFTCPYGTFAYRRMPFGLCNAPVTFQRCMTAINHDMCKDFMEVFMDDFPVFGNSFDSCLTNLSKMLARCEETNLVLHWEKCHFMVKEGIVLGHKTSKSGIEVDRAKIDVIAKLPYPTNVKGVRSFLGHAGFYRRFIKDFSKIARPMTQLLIKDAKFTFSNECMQAFDILKNKLTTAPLIIAPEWNLDFELMCDASDYAIGAVLGQRIDKIFCLIYYASKTMNDAKEHYTTTEKELLAVVYAFDNFRSYLIMSKTIVSTDHSALKYLFSKHDAKPRIIILENPNLETLNEESIQDSFPDKYLMAVHGIDFMGPLPSSRNNKYILVAINYVSKWLEAEALPTNDARVVVKFLRKLFSRFGVPKALISMLEHIFINSLLEKTLREYGVTYRLLHHIYPHTSGQSENTKPCY
ncbi:putative nucleotidyltransferase, ribonuclease H [Tanacetum coccineum]